MLMGTRRVVLDDTLFGMYTEIWHCLDGPGPGFPRLQGSRLSVSAKGRPDGEVESKNGFEEHHSACGGQRS